MDAAGFVQEVETRFRQQFKLMKAGYKSSAQERHRLEGFIQAGVFMELVSRTQMQALMDQVFVEVFGKTPSEKAQELKNFWPAEGVDYSRFDSPSYERL